MLTLITGNPGAGKSLYAVWELARKVPGSEVVDSSGKTIKRRLLSNVKNLLVDHEPIGPEELSSWHEWAKPGDVILYDEVQEVWRPRTLGKAVPDCVAALETHRHKGVDIILITQHPNLVDANIRRLVNQHIHLRRLSKRIAWRYEFDHCGTPGVYRTAMHNGMWQHPKAAYGLYKSAELHTKPSNRIPAVAWVGVLAVAGLVYLAPTAYGRITNSLGEKKPEAVAKAPQDKPRAATASSGGTAAAVPAASASRPAPVPASIAESAPVVAGCMVVASRCGCFDAEGQRVQVEETVCRDKIPKGGQPITLASVPEVARQMAQDRIEQDGELLRSMRGEVSNVPKEHIVGFRLQGSSRY